MTLKAHGNGEANTNQKIGRRFRMDETKNLAMESIAENVEPTTDESQVEQIAQPVKTYTEEEFNAKLDEVLGKKIARREAKIRKEYDRKYGELESVLRAGTGKEDVTEMTSTFRDFYTRKGIQIPTEPTYSEKDIEVLARAEADDVIRSGFEEVVDEVDRLASVGVENMNPREKAVFRTLAKYRQDTERKRELSKLGVTEDVYGSQEFNDFAAKFGPGTSITEIYSYFSKMQPKKEVKTMGSMRNSTSADGTVKDFYTREEALRFTKKDFDKNPALFKAVEQSMLKW
jgi:hypothetical protein